MNGSYHSRYKMEASYALYQVYDGEGKVEDAKRISRSNDVYYKAEERRLSDYSQLCGGCYQNGGSTLEIEFQVWNDMADFFSGLGPDFTGDRDFCREKAKSNAEAARYQAGHTPLSETLAQAISAAALAYSRGSNNPPVRSTQSNAGNQTQASGAIIGSTSGLCTEVNQYVTVKNKIVHDLSGANPIEVFPSFENHYGESVTCGYFVHHDGSYGYHGGFGGYQGDVGSGKTASLGIVEIPSDNGEIEWACFPKSQNDVNYCINRKINWTP